MANARVRNPIGQALPVNTSLTHPELPHLIMGPYTTGTALTLEPCMLVNVSNAGLLAKHTSKQRPAGVIIYSPDYNWGTTTPAITGTDLPDYIEVYICAFGPCLIQMDVSDVADASYMGNLVFESATGGMCCVGASGATAIEVDTDEAAHVSIGFQLDLLAGNTGTGTGGADGDLMEVFFIPSGGGGLIST